jgi:hypothetical protein
VSRFKNETGSVLTVADLGIQVGPGEKFEWPGHDVKVHGLPTGCAWLDAPDTPRSGDRSAVPNPADPEAANPDAAEGAESDADGPADPPPGDDAKTARKRGKSGQESGE